jgi:peptidoglycan/xylan/chitin deacetylase (PgdA/CDA1 family)
MVALTFDDGPNRRTKPFVDVLDRYGAKGTFFATWLCSRKSGMAAANRYLLAHGHELANHTMTHEPLTGTYAFDVAQIMGIERMLIQQTGKKTLWVRAMGGGVNATGLRATKNTGHLYAQWSLDSLDSHRRYTSPHRIYHNVVDHVRSGDVILLHVTHRESLAALPAILRELRRRGYKMVTLSELAAHGKPW